MVTVEEAINEYLRAATEFETRLRAAIDEPRPIHFLVEPKIRFLKISFHRLGWDSGIYARVDRQSGRIYDFLYQNEFRIAGANVFTGEYGFPTDVPEPNTELSALWIAWHESFREIPFAVSKRLAEILKKEGLHPMLEAIRITQSKRELRGDARINYVVGILRHRLLEKIAPERAAQTKIYFSLHQYWKNQPRGSGYLSKSVVLEWLQYCSADEIRCVMNSTEGLWANLRFEMDRIVSLRKEKSGEVNSDGIAAEARVPEA